QSIESLAFRQSAAYSRAIYVNKCSFCHDDSLAGSPPEFPSLVNIGSRLTRPQIASLIGTGKGRMPGFPNLTMAQKNVIADFLVSGLNKELSGSGPLPPAMKYHLTGYNRFLDPDGYPGVLP